MTTIKLKYKWEEIQKFYDDGHTWEEITYKFNINKVTLYRAMKRGYFISSRNKSEAMKLHCIKFGAFKHTEETKRKISKSRIDYLLKHPDKIPYKINHSSKRSWPEIVFENALKSAGITGWESEYQHGIYSYDFAWCDKKIDVEVDGGTHKTEKVKRIDKRRDEFSIKSGWKVIRFDANRVKKDVVGCLNELLPVLNNNKLDIV